MNECSSKKTTSQENQSKDGGKNRGVGRLQGLMARRWQTLKTCKCQGVEQKKMPRTWITGSWPSWTQLKTVIFIHDLAILQGWPWAIKAKRGTCLNRAHLPTTQLCKTILLPPLSHSSTPPATRDQGNWKKKKQNTPLARPDCSSGRGVSKSPRNDTGMK